MSFSDDDDEFRMPINDIAVTPSLIDENCDMQGIDWRLFKPTTRQLFREQRITSYRNYRNCSASHSIIHKDLHRGFTDGQFYDFRFTLTKHKYKCSEYHFQLRNLLWSTNKHSVFYSHADSIRQWNSVTHSSTEILKTERFRTSTISACPSLAFLGGFNGEFVCRLLDSEEEAPVERHGVITTDPYGITNYVELVDNRNGELTAIVSSNDCKVRLIDMKRLETTHAFDFPWAANCASLSPDKRLLCVCGDFTESSIISADSGDTIFALTGHIDYSFACAWSPCGRFVATGNQDLSTRIYDIRNPSKSLVALPTIVGAVRSLRFSDDGAFLAASEPCDFVHLYDIQGTTSSIKSASFYSDNGWKNSNNSPPPQSMRHSPLGTDAFQSQVIDFFGEIAGISFTPDGGDALYVGVSDQRYGCILEFERSRNGGGGDVYLDAFVL